MTPYSRDLALLVAVALASVSGGCEFANDRSYRGAGQLTTLHRFPRTAVKIDFPEFNLRSSFEATYDLGGLPRLHYCYLIGLAVDTDIDYFYPANRDVKPGGDGQLVLQILDGKEGRAKRCEIKLHQFQWHSHEGDTPLGSFTAQTGGCGGIRLCLTDEWEGKLVVQYSPGRLSPNLTAQVRVMSDYID